MFYHPIHYVYSGNKYANIKMHVKMLHWEKLHWKIRYNYDKILCATILHDCSYDANLCNINALGKV